MMEFALTDGKFTLTETEGRPVEDVVMYFALLQERKRIEDEKRAEEENRIMGGLSL